MRVLLVSDNIIMGKGGGCLESRKYYDALKYYCNNNGYEIKVISLDNNLPESLSTSVAKCRYNDILARLKGHSSFLYNEWTDILNKIIDYNPDIAVIVRSRLGFIAKSLKKHIPNCFIITNVDNVELDYVDAYFSMKKGVVNGIYKLLEKTIVKNDEKDTIKHSDLLIFLTKRNIKRYMEIYNYKTDNTNIIPICLEYREVNLQNIDKKTVVFIGSLDYGSNIYAVRKLIQDIWLPFFKDNENIKLVIAGNKPKKEVIDLCQTSQNIELQANFEDITSIVPRHSLMVAPIQDGAGMKVKVAESLSLGLIIAASDEALVGYEEALFDDELGGIIRANTSDELKKAILDYYNTKNDDVLKEVEMQNIHLFNKYYTFKRSRSTINNVLESIINNKSNRYEY